MGSPSDSSFSSRALSAVSAIFGLASVSRRAQARRPAPRAGDGRDYAQTPYRSQMSEFGLTRQGPIRSHPATPRSPRSGADRATVPMRGLHPRPSNTLLEDIGTARTARTERGG